MANNDEKVVVQSDDLASTDQVEIMHDVSLDDTSSGLKNLSIPMQSNSHDKGMIKCQKDRNGDSCMHEKPYRVFLCGTSFVDLILVLLALGLVYGLTAALLVLCAHATLQTDDTSTALWLFFGVAMVCVTMLGIILSATSHGKRLEKKLNLNMMNQEF